MDKINNIIGKRVRELRLRKGLTQLQVADNIGISRVYLSDLEQGKRRWNIEIITKIAKLFEVSPALLQDPEIPIEKLEELSIAIKKLSDLDIKKIKAVTDFICHLN